MKLILAASTALALFAGGAFASINEPNERPDAPAQLTTSAQKAEVKASSLYTKKELERAGLEANDTVEVTVFPSTGVVEAPSRDG